MFFFLSVCTDSGILSVIYFVKKIIDLVFLILPIVLIVMTCIDLTKNVMAKGEDDMKKNTNTAIKRIFYCIFAFFVPAIVNLVMNTVYDVTSDNGAKESYLACWTNATKENIAIYREQEEQARRDEEEQERQENQNKHEQNQEEIDNNRPSGGLSGKTDGEEDQNGNSGSSGSNSNNYTIYLGDSRTVGMCSAVNVGDNAECIAKESQGYNWLVNTGYPSAKDSLDKNPTANLVINLGTNDVGNVDKYAEFYKQILVDYLNVNVVVVSITPVDDNKAKANGYTLRNSNVNDFNSKMKEKLSGSRVKYCDINSNLTGELYGNRDDGIHHNNSTYKKIYEEIQKCL